MSLDNVLYNKVVQVESKSTETSLIDIKEMIFNDIHEHDFHQNVYEMLVINEQLDCLHNLEYR